MIAAARASYLSLPRPIRWFWTVLLALTALCLVTEAVCHGLGFRESEYIWPFLPLEHFVDFYGFLARFRFFHELNFYEPLYSHGALFAYPASVGLLYEFFYKLPGHRYVFFFAPTLLILGAMAARVGRAMEGRGVRRATVIALLSSVLLLSYPLWFEYLLGNMEMVIFLLVAGGVAALLREKHTTAAVLFGLAAAFKLYPAVYLGLLIARRKYRELAIAGGLIVGVMVLGLWAVCPSLSESWRGMMFGLNHFQAEYSLGVRKFETGFDHSLIGLVKRILHDFFHTSMSMGTLHAAMGVLAVAAVGIFFAVIQKLPVLNQICAVAVSAVWLPQTSHDYTLLHLYVPLALLALLSLDAERTGRRVAGLTGAMMCLAVALAPETEFVYQGSSFGGQIKSVALMVLFALALRYPFVRSGGVEAEREALENRTGQTLAA